MNIRPKPFPLRAFLYLTGNVYLLDIHDEAKSGMLKEEELYEENQWQ